MANTAYYVMAVRGDNDKLRKFVEDARNETYYLFYDCDGDNIEYSDGKIVICDGARWSVCCSTIIDKSGSFEDYNNNWVVKKSKDYELAIRYRSYETGMCFTEDFKVINGEVLIDECQHIEVDDSNNESAYDLWDDKENELEDWACEIINEF